MFLSNQLLWALNDHAKMRKHSESNAPEMADSMLCADLRCLELNRTAQDHFDRPCPIKVRINLETGAIES